MVARSSDHKQGATTTPASDSPGSCENDSIRAKTRIWPTAFRSYTCARSTHLVVMSTAPSLRIAAGLVHIRQVSRRTSNLVCCQDTAPSCRQSIMARSARDLREAAKTTAYARKHEFGPPLFARTYAHAVHTWMSWPQRRGLELPPAWRTYCRESGRTLAGWHLGSSQQRPQARCDDYSSKRFSRKLRK